MNHQEPELNRRSLHGIAELVLAGPQYAASQSIRLGGTFAGPARAAGVEARALRDV